MYELLLWLLPPILIVFVLIKLLMRWTVATITQNLVSKIHAAECIINKERVPEAWLNRYQARIKSLEQRHSSEQEISRVAEQAKQHCLKQLDELTTYFQQGAFVDKPETRDLLVAELRKKRQQWANSEWQPLMQTAFRCQQEIQQNGT